LLFIDEIHRLTKSQQDVLLPILEHDECWVLGATTESPQGVFQPALLSRIRLIRVEAPKPSDTARALAAVLTAQAGAPEAAVPLQGASLFGHEAKPSSRARLFWLQAWENYRDDVVRVSGGDIRLAWNVFESVAEVLEATEAQSESIKQQMVQEVFDNVQRAYTRGRHYDYASAMIKSMRGSDPDAALYYAMAALDSGEDVLFLLRRCLIFASEDVGNADPQALAVASHAHYAAANTGMPEARIPLAQAVTYLASTIKSNRCYTAISAVRHWREQAEQAKPPSPARDLAPPAELVIKGASGYVYPHDQPDAFVATEYLPPAVAALRRRSGPAYRPSQRGFEARMALRLQTLWPQRQEKLADENP
jgi:putative ATPase